MHSVNAILAQTTIRFESNASKIIHPYWRCNVDSIRRVSFAQYLLDKLSGNHSQQKIVCIRFVILVCSFVFKSYINVD